MKGNCGGFAGPTERCRAGSGARHADRAGSAARHVDVECLVEQLVEREVPFAEVLGGLPARAHLELDQTEEVVGLVQRVGDAAQVVDGRAERVRVAQHPPLHRVRGPDLPPDVVRGA